MSGLSWSEHVRFELEAERRATDDAFVRLLERRARRRRALRWLNVTRQMVCDPAVAPPVSGASSPVVPGTGRGTSGAGTTPGRSSPPAGAANPMSAPGRPTH